MACGGGAAVTLVTECVDMEAVETRLQASNSAVHVRLLVGFLNEVDDALDVVLLIRVSEDTLGADSRRGSVIGGLRLRLMIALLLVRVREAITCGGMGLLWSGVGGGGMATCSRVTGWQLLGVRRTSISTLGSAILLSFSSDFSSDLSSDLRLGSERTSGKEGKNGGKSLHVFLLYDLYDL